MAKAVFYNNKSFVVINEITPSTTILYVNHNQGIQPLDPGNEYIVGTLLPRSGEGDLEIIHIIGVNDNEFLVERGKEDTFPQSFLQGAVLEFRLTAAEIQLMNAGALRSDLAKVGGNDGGVMLVGGASPQVNTFNDLRTLIGRYEGDQANLLGHTFPGVGGGTFRWTTEVGFSDDGGMVAASTGGCWVRTSSEWQIDFFGADPSGGVSSTPALVALLASYPTWSSGSSERWKPVINFGPGHYMFDSGNVEITYGQGVFLSLVGAGINSTQIEYTGSEQYFLNFPTESVEFSGFTTTTPNSGKRFLIQRLESNHADIDCLFHNVMGVGWQYMHHCYGRGSRNVDCALGGGGTWALIESPDPFVEGSSSVQKLATGMRRYVSQNLMVDGATAIFEFSTNGPAAQYMNEVTVSGVNGNTLSSVILGGDINVLSIKTGALVNSFQPGVVNARSVRKLHLDITAVRGYDDGATPSTTTSIPYLVRLAPTAPDVGVLEDAVITGVVGNISEALVYTTGQVGNINVCNLSLPNIYEYSSSNNVSLIIAVGGILPNRKINIDNVSMSGNSFMPSGSFTWANAAVGIDALNIGQYTAGNVPISFSIENYGLATVSANQTSVVVPHNLHYTPDSRSMVQITPISDTTGAGAWYVSEITSVNFTITLKTSRTTETLFSWRIDRSRR